MSREKEGYRETLELITRKIEERFPQSMGVLTAEQCAEFLGCNIKTVLNNINKRNNPIPAKNIGVGRVIWRVPITGLARWCCG